MSLIYKFFMRSSILLRTLLIGGGVFLISANKVLDEADFVENVGGVATVENLEEKYEIQTSTYENISIVADPAGTGTDVLKMELYASDSKVANGFRTEVLPKHEYIASGRRWYAISVMVPDDWELSDAPFVLGQLHVAQKGTNLPPAISIVLRRDNLYFALQRTNFEVYEPDRLMIRDDLTTIKAPVGTLRLNRWECFIINVDWSSTESHGSLEIWNSDVGKIYEERDHHNTYPTHLGNYPKVGLYAPWKLDAQMRYVYSDFIWVGNNESNYDEMYSKTPCGREKRPSPPSTPELL